MKPKRPAAKSARAAQGSLLLVDDCALIRKSYRELLEAEGYRVVVAAHGEAAQKLALEKGPFDLLLSDCRMPGMGGVELAAWFHARWPRAGIVLFSASPEHLAYARVAAPFAKCLSKADPAHLLAAVAKLMARPPSSRRIPPQWS